MNFSSLQWLINFRPKSNIKHSPGIYMVQNLEDITETQTCQTQQHQQQQNQQQQQQWLSEDSHYPQLNHWPKLVKIVTASLLPPTTHTGGMDPCWMEQLCGCHTHCHSHHNHPSIIMSVCCMLNHGLLFRYDWVTGRPIWPTFQLPRHTLMPVVWIYTWYLDIWFYLHTL